MSPAQSSSVEEAVGGVHCADCCRGPKVKYAATVSASAAVVFERDLWTRRASQWENNFKRQFQDQCFDRISMEM